jgi:hypothetical protein
MERGPSPLKDESGFLKKIKYAVRREREGVKVFVIFHVEYI